MGMRKESRLTHHFHSEYLVHQHDKEGSHQLDHQKEKYGHIEFNFSLTDVIPASISSSVAPKPVDMDAN